MRTVLTVSTLLMLALLACSTPRAANPAAATAVPIQPTPNLDGTVQARVASTITALSKNTIAPTSVPTRPAPTALPATSAIQPISISGTGISKTDPFDLPNGNYVIDWKATATAGMTAGCFQGGALQSPEHPAVSELVGMQMVQPGQTIEGHTNAYGLKAGHYFLNMTSGCEWSVTIRPQ